MECKGYITSQIVGNDTGSEFGWLLGNEYSEDETVPGQSLHSGTFTNNGVLQRYGYDRGGSKLAISTEVNPKENDKCGKSHDDILDRISCFNETSSDTGIVVDYVLDKDMSDGITNVTLSLGFYMKKLQ